MCKYRVINQVQTIFSYYLQLDKIVICIAGRVLLGNTGRVLLGITFYKLLIFRYIQTPKGFKDIKILKHAHVCVKESPFRTSESLHFFENLKPLYPTNLYLVLKRILGNTSSHQRNDIHRSLNSDRRASPRLRQNYFENQKTKNTNNIKLENKILDIVIRAKDTFAIRFCIIRYRNGNKTALRIHSSDFRVDLAR